MSTRSPARSNTVVLQNLAKSSTPACVRESDARTLPSLSKMRHSTSCPDFLGLTELAFYCPHGAPQLALISSVHTLKLSSVEGPKLVVSATSAASLPLAIRMPDAGRIVARIECVPTIAEISLEPGRKVHARIRWRQAHITEVASAVTRRDIDATAERDGEMGKVAAHASVILQSLQSALRWARKSVAELKVLMHEIADGLDALPTSRRRSEQAPCSLRQQVGLAIGNVRRRASRRGGDGGFLAATGCTPSAPTAPARCGPGGAPAASGTCRAGPLLLRLRAAAGTKIPPTVRRARGDSRPAARE